MKRYKKRNVPNQQGIYLKKRIAKTRGRAEFIGILYLLATFAVAAVACFPLLTSALASVGVKDFWKVFTLSALKDWRNAETFVKLASAALYGFMLFGLAINVIKALSKLNWLFKKKGSKTHSFNRNVYAMEDLGNIFSGSFASVINFYFLIYVLCGTAKLETVAYVFLGAGVLVHFFCGLIGGKASYFDSDSRGNLIEQKRLIGRFAPFLRNVLQICAVAGIGWFFLKANTLSDCIAPLLERGAISAYVKPNLMGFVSVALQALTALCILVLVKHATGTSEYSIEGTEASGMKNFRVFSFFIVLTAGATAVCRYLFGEATFAFVEVLSEVGAGGTVLSVLKYKDYDSLIAAGIAFVMFVIELIMSRMPRLPENREEYSRAYGGGYYGSPMEMLEHEHEDAEDDEYDASYRVRYAYPDETEEEEESVPEREEAELEWDGVARELVCPSCGKRLEIKADKAHHRCPACGKVLELRVND